MNLAPIAILGAFLLGCAILWLPIAILQARAINWRPGLPLPQAEKLKFVLGLYLVIPLVLAGLGACFGIALSTWGIRPLPEAVTQIAGGLGIGTLGIALLFAVQLGAGWQRWQPTTLAPLAIIAPLAIGLFVGAVEEVLFRGFLQATFAPWSVLPAALVASALFAVSHLLWQAGEPGALAEQPGLFAMGLVLVLACLLCEGSIHLAWGLHAGWIWGIALVDSARLVVPTGRAPAWLTGLGGRPLAGALGFAFLGMTATVLWLLAGSG